jgi:Domain of unknown function (DUF4390)
MARRRDLRARALAVLALVGAASTGALADERPARLVGLHRRDGWLGTSVGLQDLFQAKDSERLRSGFVSRVVIRTELYREGAREPLAIADRRADILYDLWDERFRVRVIDRDGPHDYTAATAQEAILLATALYRFAVTELSRLQGGVVYRLRFRADLNPLSEDLVQEVRRWLVRAPGQGRAGSSDSVFGSVVSIFVNPRVEESERQITFWSQSFVGVTP